MVRLSLTHRTIGWGTPLTRHGRMISRSSITVYSVGWSSIIGGTKNKQQDRFCRLSSTNTPWLHYLKIKTTLDLIRVCLSYCFFAYFPICLSVPGILFLSVFHRISTLNFESLLAECCASAVLCNADVDPSITKVNALDPQRSVRHQYVACVSTNTTSAISFSDKLYHLRDDSNIHSCTLQESESFCSVPCEASGRYWRIAFWQIFKAENVESFHVIQ